MRRPIAILASVGLLAFASQKAEPACAIQQIFCQNCIGNQLCPNATVQVNITALSEALTTVPGQDNEFVLISVYVVSPNSCCTDVGVTLNLVRKDYCNASSNCAGVADGHNVCAGDSARHNGIPGPDVGTFTPACIHVNATGSGKVAKFLWTPPEVSGEIQIWAIVDCTAKPASPKIVTAKWPDLIEMGPGSDYSLVGQTSAHSSNHWARSEVRDALVAAAAQLKQTSPSCSPMKVNDIALPWGGLFDIGPVHFDPCKGEDSGNSHSSWWSTDHVEHRTGQQADVPWGSCYSEVFAALFGQGFEPADHGNHWHARFGGAHD